MSLRTACEQGKQGVRRKKRFFPRFFQKSVRGVGQSPIKSFRKACSPASIAGGLTAFVRLRLCRTNEYGFAEDKICYFCLFARESCSGS